MPNALNKLLAKQYLDPTWKPAGGGLGLFPIGEDAQGNVGFGIPGIIRNPLVSAERSLLDTLAQSSGINEGDYLDEGTRYQPMSQPTDAFDAASLAPIAGVALKAARPALAADGAGALSANGTLTKAADNAGDYLSKIPPDREVPMVPYYEYQGGYYTGYNHPDALGKAVDMRGPDAETAYHMATSEPTGYLTSLGRPVLRSEAKKLAVDAGMPLDPFYVNADWIDSVTVNDYFGIPKRAQSFADGGVLDHPLVDYVRSQPGAPTIFSNPDEAAMAPLMTRALEAEGALPMDQASRLSRAAEQGYDTSTVFYRGMPDANRLTPEGGFIPGDWSGKGKAEVFATSDPEYASWYAQGFHPKEFEQAPGVFPVYIKRGEGARITDHGDGTFTAAVSDPSNIRSVNAAFDPSKVGQNGLLFSNSDEAASLPLLTRALEEQGQGLPALPRVAPSLPDSAVVRGPVFKNNTGAPGFALEETNAGRALPTDPRRFSAVFRDAEGVPRGSVSYATDKDGNLIAKNAYGEDEEVTLFVDPEYRGSNVALGLIKQMLDAGVRVTPETLQALSFTRQGAAFANRTLQRLSAADPVLVRQYLGLMSNPDEAAAIPLMARALEAEQPGFIAYHGSPHDFDRFDLSKIGTGEGAQAYGHGLYFAENEGVAKAYRDQLGNYSDAVKWNADTPPSPVQEQLLNMLRGPDVQRGEAMTLDALDRDLTKQILAIRRMEFMPEAEKAAKIAQLQKQREELAAMSGSVELNPPGRMYEVRIKADPESFLDWDKPLSQQSEAVRNALSDLPPELLGSEAYRKIAEDAGVWQGVGGQTWKQAQNLYSSNALKEKGIPGIRYLDAGSRDDLQGTRNAVVFDDALIEILRKYGLLGAFAGGASLNSLLSEQPEG